MNPFKKIDPKAGLLKDSQSPFYGRYRLCFDQVLPFRELTFGRVFIKVQKDGIENVKNIYESFPQHLKYQIQLFNQMEIRNNEIILINCFEDSDWFLCLDMTGDVAFLPMYNFYFALKSLSEYLEDCHFFIYSSGDLDDRWIDEYKIIDGKLQFSRNTMETEAYWGAVIYYLKNAIKENTLQFKRFAAFQLYDLLFDKYANDEAEDDDKRYDEFGEGINDDIQEHIELMSTHELTTINKSLKILFNLSLDNSLKNELNKTFAFNLLSFNRVGKG